MKRIQNLNISSKLGLLGIIVLIAILIPGVLFTESLLESLNVSKRSAQSEGAFRSLIETVRQTQTSRGLAAGYFAGNKSLEGKLRDAASQASKSLEQLGKELASTDASKATLEHAQRLQQEWVKLKDEIYKDGFTGAQSFARHTALIAGQLKLMDMVMDDYGLSLEPNPDLYFLMQGSLEHLPWLTEHLGQLRGLGNGLLTAKQADDGARRRLSVMMEGANTRAQRGRAQVEKSLKFNSTFESALKVPVSRAMDAADGVVKLAREQIIDVATLSLAPEEYFRYSTASIDAVFGLIQASIDQISYQLKLNVAKGTRTLIGASAALAALLVVLIWLAIALSRSITQPLNRAVQVANAVARGDLSLRIESQAENETGKLLAALAQMQQGLVSVVASVRQNADSVSVASSEIAQGSDDLSRRTENQASALEETAASMEQINSTVTQNAENVRHANASANEAAEVARHAGAVVEGFAQTMEDINRSSKSISDIIAVIDGIAFQTNILALNAAVEAARAGEAGRGFAVVASEVRSLAQRSAEAAKEIKGLITESVTKVDVGTAQVEDALSTFRGVVDSITKVSEMMTQISMASEEQRSGIEQVSEAITQMDEVTQQNAALVEQSTAAAATLQQQARHLVETVAVFRLGEDDPQSDSMML